VLKGLCHGADCQCLPQVHGSEPGRLEWVGLGRSSTACELTSPAASLPVGTTAYELTCLRGCINALRCLRLAALAARVGCELLNHTVPQLILANCRIQLFAVDGSVCSCACRLWSSGNSVLRATAELWSAECSGAFC
jgi:hypothetical protein